MVEANQHRILVVDQDLGALTALDSLFTREGYPVTTAGSPADALKAVARSGFDLVIAGTRVLEGVGIALVWKIKDLSRGTKVLLLFETAVGLSDRDLMAAGVDGFLRRPFTDLQALECVERLFSPKPAAVEPAVVVTPPRTNPSSGGGGAKTHGVSPFAARPAEMATAPARSKKGGAREEKRSSR